MPDRRVVRRQLDALAKMVRRRLEVAAVERADAPVLLGDGALEQSAQLHHQRIRRTDLHAALLTQVRFGARRVAQGAIG